MSNDLILLLCGFVGVLFHCSVKLDSLQSDARVGNVPFNWKTDYLKKDRVAIVSSFLSVIIWYLVFHEVAAKYPALEGFSRVSFVTMGAIGSYVIQLILGKAKKQIRRVIDVKTDIADNKTKE